MDSPPPHDAQVDAAPTSGAILASILECPFRPAAAAMRTLHCALRTAWLVHMVCALGALLVVIMANAWIESGEPLTTHEFVDRAQRGLGNFLSAFAAYPLLLLLAVVGIEIGYAALSLWLLPWGACDEPIRDSLAHALRRVWMQTPQLFLFVALAGTVLAGLERAHSEWMVSNGSERPDPPPWPPNMVVGTPQWDQYNQQTEAYIEKVREITREEELRQPFHVRYGMPLAGVGCFALGVTFLISLLRAAGVLRRSPPAERQPLCEACGYDLTTMPMESRCPECGDAVLASLGPAARPGPPWTDPRLGVVTAWFRSWRQAIFSPTAFGRSIRVTDPGTHHRVFYMMHLPLIFLIAACAPPVLFRCTEGHWPVGENLEVFLFLSPAAGFICMAAASSVMLKSAAWAGWFHWWKLKRNLLPATMQISCYLVVYLVVWEFLGGAFGILCIVLANREPFIDWFRGTRVESALLLTFAWFGINLICLGVYSTIVKCAVAATRFANK